MYLLVEIYNTYVLLPGVLTFNGTIDDGSEIIVRDTCHGWMFPNICIYMGKNDIGTQQILECYIGRL